MKKVLFFVFFAFTFANSQAQLNLVLDYATFYSPEQGPYIEFYLNINGNSLSYQSNENGKLQGSIEFTYLIEKGDSVVTYEKFRMNSPEYVGQDIPLDMRNMQRLPIPNGEFSFTLMAKDLNSGQEIESSQDLRKINYSPIDVRLSEILIADTAMAGSEGLFNKSGFDFEPNFQHFFGPNNQTIYFYAEIYNSNVLGDGEEYLFEYMIEEIKSGNVSSGLRAFSRQKANEVTPIIKSFALYDLPSGKYRLRLNVKDRNNDLLATQQTEFYRSNPDLINYSTVDLNNSFVDTLDNKEVLAEYIRSTYPIATPAEREFAKNQLRFSDLKFMQQYFLNFWKSRNPEEPYYEWLRYKAEVDKVQTLFGYAKTKGYQTERGRVYLQYGAPNAMMNMPYEPNTFPYSIWHYNKINGISNRKFLFFSPSMEILGYEVLHSNVPGEIQNPNWEIQLMNKTNAGVRPTQETPENTMVNRRARDLWENPR